MSWAAWLYVRRQRRPLELVLAAPTAADAARRAAAAPADRRFRIRLRDNGSVWCRRRRSRNTTPPYFTGRLQDTNRGVELAGTIHESRETMVLPQMYTGLTLFMAVIAVASAASRVIPGLVVCAPAAVAFAAIALFLRRLRPSTFALEADELTKRLGELFVPTPDLAGRPPYRRGPAADGTARNTERLDT